MSTRDGGRRLGDFNFVMNSMKSIAEQRNIWVEQMNITAANDIFSQILPSLAVSADTAKGRKRRTAQIKWETVSKLLRKSAKATPAGAGTNENDEENEEEQQQEGNDDLWKWKWRCYVLRHVLLVFFFLSFFLSSSFFEIKR